LFRPGEGIPLDSVIVEGESSIDESSVTGESILVSKKAGDPVFAATINQTGGLEVRVTKLAKEVGKRLNDRKIDPDGGRSAERKGRNAAFSGPRRAVLCGWGHRLYGRADCVPPVFPPRTLSRDFLSGDDCDGRRVAVRIDYQHAGFDFIG